jgi:exodeoxyribonuclease VII large subunit
MQETSSKLLATLFAESRIYSVSELNESIKDILETEFFTLHVQGEISNYKRHTSGHWYFTLKDADSQLRAVFFRQWNRLLRFEPENGLEVRLRGRLSVYEPRGEYQIVVETIEPIGVGTLQLAFQQQLKRLSQEGLFDEMRKRPVPVYPRWIGIVTSPVGAVLRDMLQILQRRNPTTNILIAPVRVQGNGAAGEIADAIRLLNKHAKKTGCPIDVLIVGRGGGSMEDLWAFNEEQVARAIFVSEIPVISAVGHETDFTIADLVADLRAPTPSAAAELVAAESSAILARVSMLSESLQRAIFYYLLRRRYQLRQITERRGFADTSRLVIDLAARSRELQARAAAALKENFHRANWRLKDVQHRLHCTDFRAPILVNQAKLNLLRQRLERALQRRIERESRKVVIAASKLHALSPLSVLGRGYALVKNESGKLVTRAVQLTPGQKVKIRFEDGETDCQIVSA